jgi:hypothetical protein
MPIASRSSVESSKKLIERRLLDQRLDAAERRRDLEDPTASTTATSPRGRPGPRSSRRRRSRASGGGDGVPG